MQRFSLPAWIPGSYLLRDFARHVVHAEAKSGSAPLAVEKTAAAEWCVRGARGTLDFTITVYALDLSVRGAYLDRGRAYFNGDGGCAACHSPTGDLAGYGARYAPVDIQQRFVFPGASGRRTARSQVTVTVTRPAEPRTITAPPARFTTFSPIGWATSRKRPMSSTD